VGEFLIVKVGSTFPSLQSQRGDFEDWIRAGMQLDVHQTLVLDPREGDCLPSADGVGGVVVTGSHSAVTEHQAWNERAATWLLQIVQREIPLLGICYGHQLLAYALGGEVGDNPNGPEYGTVKMDFLDDARHDPLFRDWASPVLVHVSHTQTVLRLPARAVPLASSRLDRHQAFRVGTRAWGVQFHPEFDLDIVSEYVRQSRRVLGTRGQQIDLWMEDGGIPAAQRESTVGPSILRRFAELVLVNDTK
jgi:GMP synthase (glutamine-hydrolysing)